MPYVKTNWENREVERPRTYTQTTNADGTITLTPSEGEILVSGTPLDSTHLNNIENGIEEVFNDFQGKKITADDGSVILSAGTTADDILQIVEAAGIGFRTLYAINGSVNLPPDNLSIRGFSHITSAGYGYVWAIDYKNQVSTNYLDNGVWTGWRGVSHELDWTNVTYQNGWQSRWGTARHLKYALSPDKRLLYIAGTAQVPSPYNATIATLPTGFRPLDHRMFVVPVVGEFVWGRVTVAANGQITLDNNATAAGNYLDIQIVVPINAV